MLGHSAMLDHGQRRRDDQRGPSWTSSCTASAAPTLDLATCTSSAGTGTAFSACQLPSSQAERARLAHAEDSHAHDQGHADRQHQGESGRNIKQRTERKNYLTPSAKKGQPNGLPPEPPKG